jgi:release factor glutamine methyltransferase
MTVGEFLKSATHKLIGSDISTARLDCLVLLEDAMNIDRANLIAHPETIIPSLQEVKLNKKIVQRSSHTPLAYLRGKVEFYGRDFKVNRNVLVPRPETEEIIDLLLKINLASAKIADIGTGSGCIGITASLELPASSVDLYDISPEALRVARQNTAELNAPINIYEGNLLKNLRNDYDIILANLPYVPDGYPVNLAAQQEPPLALFAGDDGMEAYRDFWHQVNNLKNKPQYIITESLRQQHEFHSTLANSHGYKLFNTSGLAQAYTLK